jgi:hypothetical protein
MIWRSHQRGTPVLKMQFRGVGRIERATGFHDPAMLPRLKEMCRTLYEADKLDVLRAMKAGQLTLKQVWAVYKRGDWKKLPTAAHALPFAETFDAWAKTKPVASYRRFCVRVRSALGNVGTLGDLHSVLLRYRTRCEIAGTGAMWNRVQSKVMAFLRDTLTTDHVLYSHAAALASLTEARKRGVNPLPPDQAAAVSTMLGGESGRIWWFLCCHGMMPDEFFRGKWRIEDGRLHILGTKTVTRARTVPLLAEPFTPVLSQGGFASALREAKLGVSAYDGRRSFGLWCDLAGFPEGWKKALLGHAQSITQMYGWRETERMLEKVEPVLRALIEKVVGQVVGHGA